MGRSRASAFSQESRDLSSVTEAAELSSYDAIVVGAGPNGLAAAVVMAQAGKSVLVCEAADTVGGGARTDELTLPGFQHDVCSSIFPLAAGSPLFATLPLERHGVEWVHPPAPMAHPFDDGSAVTLERTVEATADQLGRDARAYQKLMAPLVADWDRIVAEILGPLRPPRHPIALGRFGLKAIRSASGLANGRFETRNARGLFGGLGGHSIQPLERWPTAAFALVLGMAGHAIGWPLARGGAQRISDALASYLRSLGGEILTGTAVESLDDLPASRAVLCDIGPTQLLKLAGDRLSGGYRRRLERYRYGPGVFKMDWALDGPVPWAASECARGGTVHLGGALEEVALSERTVWEGSHPEKPYVLFAQPSLFDDTRAPEGKHTAWAYCHVPNGSTFDMAERIESQVERFAPGFRDLVLERSVRTPAQLEEYNPNCLGGDINGGIQDLGQLFTRPAVRPVPYSTPAKGLYICSSSTPPGGGVHGMCGYHAARAALRSLF